MNGRNGNINSIENVEFDDSESETEDLECYTCGKNLSRTLSTNGT